MNISKININCIADTINLAKRIANFILKYGYDNNINIHFNGQIGTGKTTLIKAILQNCGIKDKIKSPSYTILETYDNLSGLVFYHLDFYRFNEVDDLILTELEDYMIKGSIILIEWSEIIMPQLKKPDISVSLEYTTKLKRIAKVTIDKEIENQWLQ